MSPARVSGSNQAPPPAGVFGGSAWRLGRIFGIEIAIDQSWLLIFGLVTFSLAGRMAVEHETSAAIERWGVAVAASLVFFASLLLHELGHSVVALQTGLEVRSITLFLFGGVAQLGSEPRRPRDEIWIALAGPAVSAALGLGFLALADVLSAAGSSPLSSATAWLGSINLALAIFNLAPGFPLDGGRVLRGIVWGVTGSFERATQVASTGGAIVARTLMAMGAILALATGQLLGGLWLVLIGWFLLQAARGPARAMRLERTLGEIRVGDVMEPVARAFVGPSLSVASALQDKVLLHGLRTLYVVESDFRLLGIVTLRELAAVPPEQRASCRLCDLMTPVADLHLTSSDESGWRALEEMASYRLNQLPVVDGGRLQGCVSREGLLNVLHAAIALERQADTMGTRLKTI